MNDHAMMTLMITEAQRRTLIAALDLRETEHRRTWTSTIGLFDGDQSVLDRCDELRRLLDAALVTSRV